MSNEQLTWLNSHQQDKPGLAWRTETNPINNPKPSPMPEASQTIAGRSQTPGRATTNESTPAGVEDLPAPNQQTAKTNPITKNPSVILCETPCNSVAQNKPTMPINNQLAAEKTNPITTNSSVQLCETPCNFVVKNDPKTPTNHQLASEKTNPITENPSVQLCETSCNSVVKSNAETPTNHQPADSRNLSDVDQFLNNKANVSLQDINPDAIETHFCACHKTKQAIIALTRAREELGMSRRDIARMIGVSVETTARIEFNKQSPFELIVRYVRAILNPV